MGEYPAEMPIIPLIASTTGVWGAEATGEMRRIARKVFARHPAWGSCSNVYLAMQAALSRVILNAQFNALNEASGARLHSKAVTAGRRTLSAAASPLGG